MLTQPRYFRLMLWDSLMLKEGHIIIYNNNNINMFFFVDSELFIFIFRGGYMYNPFSFKTPEGCLTCTTCIKSPDILMGLRLTHAVLQESSVDYDKILGLLETYFASLEQLLKSDLLDHILYRALTHLSIFAFKSGTH